MQPSDDTPPTGPAFLLDHDAHMAQAEYHSTRAQHHLEQAGMARRAAQGDPAVGYRQDHLVMHGADSPLPVSKWADLAHYSMRHTGKNGS